MATLLQSVISKSADQAESVDNLIASLENLPTVELPPLDDLVVTVPPTPPVSSDMVQVALAQLQRELGQTTPRTPPSAVVTGDEVLVDLIGFAGGEYVPLSAQSELWLTEETSALLPGLRSALDGVEIGGDTTVTVQYPEDFSEERLRGAQITYGVSVRAARVVEPALESSAELCRALDVTDASQARDRLRETLGQALAAQQRHAAETALGYDLATRAKLEVPEALVLAEARRRWFRLEGEVLQRGSLPYDQQQAAFNHYIAISEVRAEIERDVRLALVLVALVRHWNIEPSVEEVDEMLGELAVISEVPEEELRQAIKDGEDQQVAGFGLALAARIARQRLLAHVRFTHER